MRDNLGIASRLAGNLPVLLLRAEKVAHGFMRGLHGRRRTGHGETFWQFRAYQPGDSSRDIDWRQTAKRDEVFVRQLEWEAAQAVWLHRDASPSMDFRSSHAVRAKKDYAEILLLALSMVLLNGGEQAGLLGTDLAPQAHAGAVSRLAESLARQDALLERRRIVADSHVVLFGDFYGGIESLASFCLNLAERGVRGLLVQVCDPAERDLPFHGRVKFLDMADSEALTIPQVDAVRAEYLNRFSAHRQSLMDMTTGFGWDFLHAATDEKEEAVLARIYDLMAAKRGMS